MSRKRRHHEEHEEHVDESWLIPYADLLTLLLALFIVLYAMNTVDIKKFQEMSQAFRIVLNAGGGVLDLPSVTMDGENTDRRKNGDDKDANKDQQNDRESTLEQLDPALQELIRREEAEFEDLKRRIDDYIDKNGLTTDLETHLNMSQLVITISDNALFAPAQATVKPEARQLATEIGKMLSEYPDYDVVIAGHTDDRPINNAQFRSNWDLSTIRAVRFLDIMLENENNDPKRFSAIGYGEYHPVADNSTEEGRAKNRRVEVSIIHTYVDNRNVQSLRTQQSSE